jgi:hypothetical protein
MKCYPCPYWEAAEGWGFCTLGYDPNKPCQKRKKS